jgi:hypothetical protein
MSLVQLHSAPLVSTLPAHSVRAPISHFKIDEKRQKRSVSMRLRVLLSLLLLILVACLLAAETASNVQKFSAPTRGFRFSYNFTVKDIPSEARRVRVWAPVPQTDQHQIVRIVAVKAPAKIRITQETQYGNQMMYANIQNPAQGKAEFTLEYQITRREYSRGDYTQLKRTDQKPALVSASMTRLIAPTV